MRTLAILISFILLGTELYSQDNNQHIVTSDIDNFWKAYDKITTTKDSAQQYNYLNQLFIEKGSPGLKGIMEVRDYTAKSYIDAINNYPLFWNSVRENTFRAKGLAKDIEVDVKKLKIIYPALKPATIYFTIGALRTGGTISKGMILIGSEIALADKSTVTTEIQEKFTNLRSFFDGYAREKTVFTNVHEYVHTQQKTTIGDYLLVQSVLEGVAEFVAVKATGRASSAPCISYGQANNDKIKQRFEIQMFNPSNGYWLYNNMPNEFNNTRDLGYYVGYAICEKYYGKATDKKQAIKEMIELDYNNETQLAQFVDKSGYFSQSVQTAKDEFEKNRPVIIGVKQFENKSNTVDPNLKQITIEFSSKMDTRYRNFDYGPAGEKYLLKLKKWIGFSEDGKSATFEVELKPGQQYEVVLGQGFRNGDGLPLKPYLLTFKTI